MKRWEYKLLSAFVNVENKLNELGADGWELVAVSATEFYFKREITLLY